MGIDRRVLIIGNAMLFSTLGCDDGGEPALDMAPPTEDARTADAEGMLDMTPEDDMGPEGDMAPEVDMSLEADTGVEGDMAPPELDMSIEADMAPPELDMTPPELDMEPIDPDMAPPVPDMEPPEPDMAPPVPDMAPPPAMCVDTLGEACRIENEGCCPDAQNPEAVCWRDQNGNLTWQTIPEDFFCNCIPEDTTFQVICAVPGFVGIAVAGRVLTGPRLRTLRSLYRAAC